MPSSPRRLIGAGRQVERRARVAAVRAGVVAEMPDVDRAVVVGVPAAHAEARVGGVRRGRQRHRRDRRCRSARPPDAPRRCEAVSGSSAATTSVVEGSRPRDQLAPARRHELELAVAVELIAEEVAERDRARARADRRWPGSAASSHSKRPSSAEAASRTASAEAMPEARLAPALLRASCTRPRSTSASSAQVVVLPFVAETRTQPRGSRAGEPPRRVGRERGQHAAGQRRAAAAAGRARSERRCASGGECQPHHRRSPSTQAV